MTARRDVLRGLAALPVAIASPALAAPAAISGQADAELIAWADAYEALEQRCNEHAVGDRHLSGAALEAAEGAFSDLTSGFEPLGMAIASTRSDTMVGVLAKARACQVPSARDFDGLDMALSIADDLVRLAAKGLIHA